jgi:ADP-ribose pyrophosphatase YjhB (NUDIX family)
VRARFCVRCGTKLARKRIEHRMREVCPECGHIAFRNAKPAVGLLIERNARLLLVRRARPPFKGYWDIPGGFLEEDEAPRSGAMREAREETGLRIGVDGLIGAYLGRNRGEYTMNLYFTAHVSGGRAKAGDDADELRWFALKEIPKRIAFPGHTRAVLRDWRKGRG